MAKNSGNEKYAYLNRLSTQQLEALLRADIESPESGDRGVIFHILEVIESREEECPTGCLPDEDRAWEEFQQYYNIPEGEGLSLYPIEAEDEDSAVELVPVTRVKSVRRSPALRAASIVAIAIIGAFTLMIGAQAAGIDVFGFIGRWTGETFRFVPASSASDSVSSKESDSESPLKRALRECDIPEQIAPTRFPAGFEMGEPEIIDGQLYSSVVCHFSGFEGKSFILQIDRFYSTGDVPLVSFEKDNDNVVTYVSGVKTFYIFSNLDLKTAVWSEDTLVLSISGNISDDEIRSIIDSIGE